ncbi:hypothetical protein DWB77_02103 [Streptomyces hundungensis]|uniref:Uncharacterized protein n=1 Tax=Streptomyces hundungensis TaxID=1077946 RepID=A0A387H949_9ACTN|nr:hypothetical protein [Streptomyces hundungensis]AYG79984.1 hypothetical protein DWB77_02103 [Streptomyces hundungensis]
MQKVLPDVNTLIRMKEQGLTDDQIGARYGVVGQAVNKALTQAGYYRQAVSRQVIEDAIPWTVKRTQGAGSHHTSYLGKAVMAYLRVAMGDDTAKDSHRVAAKRLRARLIRDKKVIDYDPQSKDGFELVDREARDGDLIFRWPADVDLPEGKVLEAITLSA